MDDRIVELETRLAFQDESIHALNQSLLEQQKIIDGLQRELRELKERFQALTPSPLEEDGVEPPPPHY